jgi:hypothetical protein
LPPPGRSQLVSNIEAQHHNCKQEENWIISL